MSWSTAKATKWPVRPVKTQISLRIHPVIRVLAVRMMKPWVLSYPLSAQQRHWSDWADTQADLSLRWIHIILLVLSCAGSNGSWYFFSGADNNRATTGRPPHGPQTSPHPPHASRIPVRKGSGSQSCSLPEDLDQLKKLVSDLQARNKNLDDTLRATEETVRVQTQKMKHYKNMLIDHGLLSKSMSRSSSDPNLASCSPCFDRQSRQSSRYHSTDNLTRHRSMSPAPSVRNSNQNEDFQRLLRENDQMRSQIDGYKRVLKVFQDRASASKDSEGRGQGSAGPQPISSESASCLLDNWLDMIDKFLLELSQGDQNGHMPVTASTTEVTRLRRGLVQARGAIQSLSHGSVGKGKKHACKISVRVN